MEINIVQEKENKLFKRKEIVATIEADSVPKVTETIDVLATKLSVPKENIAVGRVWGKFGSKTFEVLASVYDSRDALESIEPKHNIPKIEEAPAEEAQIEEIPTEAPAEASPEENKGEESSA